MSLILVRGPRQLLALVPRLAYLFETALPEIETDLPETETDLPEIMAALPEIEILPHELDNK